LGRPWRTELDAAQVEGQADLFRPASR
jgi:hypothetical protein